MDIEKLQRRQSLKVIASEAIMVITVIITVVILGFVVSGYWLNSNFEVERQGMLQIYSTPTGASVEIDGESSWLQRTNTSKVLASGEHTVTLTKDGYDSWSKTINISEGLLYRIHYPRLFLKERSTEKVLDATNTSLATMSADHELLILINDTTSWSVVNLNSNNVVEKKIDIAKFFQSASVTEDKENGIFEGEILDIDWDRDSAHALFKVKYRDNIEWVLLDVKNIEKSINLSKEFGWDFDNIKILDNSSNNLLAIQNGKLCKIDVSGRSISAILAENVIDFDYYNNEIVFSAQTPTEGDIIKELSGDSSSYFVGYFKLGDERITGLTYVNSPAKVAISRFYDDKLITILDNDVVNVYKEDGLENILTSRIAFIPEKLKVGTNGEFIIMYQGANIATLDMEASVVREWSIENANFDWLDNYMIYVINDEGNLVTYDYDGLNRRVLAADASSHFPAGITDNKWLYYFADGNLVREWLIPR